MKKDTGDKDFPLWLLGDSNPKQWIHVLNSPLDPRHPLRHNIWTSVIDVTQDRVFRELGKRIDTMDIYIRNAVEDASLKPKSGELEWSALLTRENDDFGLEINKYKPQVIFAFGAFAFEFAQRAVKAETRHKFGYWGAEKLGVEFRRQMNAFDVNRTNIVPLLHGSIVGHFIASHEQFCSRQKGANYFEMAGNRIADEFIRNNENLKIWIPKPASAAKI